MNNHNKLETVFDIGSDSFYDIDEKEEHEYIVPDKKFDYTEIKSIYPSKAERAKIYLRSILFKVDFAKDIDEEIEHYYYICNKCEMMVYYWERDSHIASHIEDKPFCECVIV